MGCFLMKFRKILTGILTICLVNLSFISVVQLNAQTVDNAVNRSASIVSDDNINMQTAKSPMKEFVIKNRKDFSKFMKTPEYWGSDFNIKLNVNINMIVKKFEPINEFRGNFDGCGHTIKNVLLRCFVKNNYGKISRVNFEKSVFLDSKCGFVENNYGIITECKAKGNIKGYCIKRHFDLIFGFVIDRREDKDNMGGFVINNSGTITNCKAEGNVNGNSYVGGFVGWNSGGKIINCKYTGKVNGKNYVGRFVGENDSNIEKCTATGKVTGKTSVGGFVGLFYGGYGGTITKCDAKGEVKGNKNVGGFIGENFFCGIITSCTVTGNVNGNINVGGFIGENWHGTITECTATCNLNGKKISLDKFVGLNYGGEIKDCKV